MIIHFLGGGYPSMYIDIKSKKTYIVDTWLYERYHGGFWLFIVFRGRMKRFFVHMELLEREWYGYDVAKFYEEYCQYISECLFPKKRNEILFGLIRRLTNCFPPFLHWARKNIIRDWEININEKFYF